MITPQEKERIAEITEKYQKAFLAYGKTHLTHLSWLLEIREATNDEALRRGIDLHIGFLTANDGLPLLDHQI